MMKPPSSYQKSDTPQLPGHRSSWAQDPSRPHLTVSFIISKCKLCFLSSVNHSSKWPNLRRVSWEPPFVLEVSQRTGDVGNLRIHLKWGAARHGSASLYSCNPSTQEVEAEGSQFQANLSYIVRSCLKNSRGRGVVQW
jgi:hypothetical protein